MAEAAWCFSNGNLILKVNKMYFVPTKERKSTWKWKENSPKHLIRCSRITWMFFGNSMAVTRPVSVWYSCHHRQEWSRKRIHLPPVAIKSQKCQTFFKIFMNSVPVLFNLTHELDLTAFWQIIWIYISLHIKCFKKWYKKVHWQLPHQDEDVMPVEVFCPEINDLVSPEMVSFLLVIVAKRVSIIPNTSRSSSW